MKSILKLILLMALFSLAAFGQGTIVWNESVNGPFSFDYHNPTLLGGLSLGSNTVIGATEIEPTGPDYFVHEDYFSFIVPNNSSLSAIYIDIDKPNVWTWIGDTSYLSQLGFTGSPSSGELLSQWGLSGLGPGSYGMYLANHDAQPITSIADYRLDFFVQNIPEPRVIPLLIFGLGLLGLCNLKSIPKPRK